MLTLTIFTYEGRSMVLKRLTAARFIAAIKGSGGIKSTICKRVGCDILTLQKYLVKYPTIGAAYEDECNKILGLAHSVVVGNIQIARKQQSQEGADQVDSKDAKWYLSRKGRHEGFGKDVSTPQVTVNVSLADWKRNAAERRKQVDDLEEE